MRYGQTSRGTRRGVASSRCTASRVRVRGRVGVRVRVRARVGVGVRVSSRCTA